MTLSGVMRLELCGLRVRSANGASAALFIPGPWIEINFLSARRIRSEIEHVENRSCDRIKGLVANAIEPPIILNKSNHGSMVDNGVVYIIGFGPR